MHRRKVLTVAAIFALGAAFAAEPLSERKIEDRNWTQGRIPWVPGANMLMSSREWDSTPLPPSR